MKKIFIVCIALLSLCGCTQSSKTKRVLTEMGYKNVKTHGYAWVFSGCGDEDTRTKFTAISPNGEPVSGVACANYFSTLHLRFN